MLHKKLVKKMYGIRVEKKSQIWVFNSNTIQINILHFGPLHFSVYSGLVVYWEMFNPKEQEWIDCFVEKLSSFQSNYMG